MKKITYFILLSFIVSCDFFKEKNEYAFTYEFENKNQITQSDILETITILNKRLDRFGFKYVINKYKGKRLNLKIKALDLDSTRINNIITNQGKLEFWEIYNGEVFQYNEGRFFKINETKTENNFDAKLDLDIVFSRYKGAPEILRAKAKDTSAINAVINEKGFKSSLPSEIGNVKFLWGIYDQGYHPLYAAKPNKENKASLTGVVITDARQSFGYTDKPEIVIEMNDEGALIWERITGEAFKNNTKIAITLNDIVYSAPGVTSGPISGGRSSISGNFTLQEAQDLAIILSSQGSIPKLKLVNK